MSGGKKLIALSVFMFVVLIVVGASYSGHHGDASGTATGNARDYLTASGTTTDQVPLSQEGINKLANDSCCA